MEMAAAAAGAGQEQALETPPVCFFFKLYLYITNVFDLDTLCSAATTTTVGLQVCTFFL
jgi:hypothetical protein